MAWLHVRGLGELSLDSSFALETPTAPFVTLNGKPSQRPLSWRGWKTRPWIRRLSGTILRPSMAQRGVEQWISSLVDSRVSPSAQPAASGESKTSAGSGLTLQGSLLNPSHNLCSWRTCRASWTTDCESCGLIFDAWVSEFALVSSVRQKLAPLTDDSDCSSWPTPTWGDSKSSGSRNTASSKANQGVSLTDMVMTGGSSGRQPNTTWTRGEYPTPSATPYGTSQNEGSVAHDRPSRGTPSLDTWASGLHHQDPENGRMVLNPRFVEWLLGLPIGMTGSEPLGIRWSLWYRRMRSELYGKR